jgi:hypothetical protein
MDSSFCAYETLKQALVSIQIRSVSNERGIATPPPRDSGVLDRKTSRWYFDAGLFLKVSMGSRNYAEISFVPK